MSEIYNQQQAILRVIERSLENFKKIGKNNYTPAKIRSRITSLKETWAQCLKMHALLLQATPEANRASLDYFRLAHFERADDLVHSALDYMAECLEELEPPSLQHSSFQAHRSCEEGPSFAAAKLPPISLPQFSGRFEDWEGFRDRFTALITDNKTLSPFARMHYLTSSLIGNALEAISHIPVTADNFNIAWTALVERFENKQRLIEVHVSALFNLPAVTRESAAELSALRHKANGAIASLKNLNRTPAAIASDILVFAVSQKLDPATRKAWKLRSGDEIEIPLYEQFDHFLASRARALESMTPSDVNKLSRPPRTTNVHLANVPSVTCGLCNSSHFLSKCPKFVGRSPNQRLEIVTRLNRCTNCLSAKHKMQECPSKYTCRTCHQQHHTMLHSDSVSSLSTSTSPAPSTGPHDHFIPESASVLLTPCSTPAATLLATARVRVIAPSGRSVVVRALIDQGSMTTFVTERVRQTLRLIKEPKSLSVSVIGGVEVGTSRYAAGVVVAPVGRDGPMLHSLASVLKTLTNYVPSRSDTTVALDWIEGLPLADPDVFGNKPIDILIGSDIYGGLILEGLRKGNSDTLVAQNTIFGWILSGRGSSSGGSTPRVAVHHGPESSGLEQELRKFWEVEEAPRRTFVTPEEKQCEDHFLTTHSRDPSGRYVVRLPFRFGPPLDIGKSRVTAESCLKGLHRRFQSQPLIKAEYSQFMREYEDLGHMTLVSRDCALSSQIVYIPHHPVIRESSSTTRLRVVFNASSRTTNSTSLNDHLIAGPKLQTDLAAVILRWRSYRFVMSGDIAKMYRQILVDPRDAPYQRILWANDGSEPVRDYQLNTVTYGTSAAPYLALRVLQQLLQDEGHTFPLAVPVMRDNIYVDDLLFGADDIPLLRQIREQVRALLRRGHFDLRKWSSNSASLLSDLEQIDHEIACNKTLQTDESLKILGISWSPSRDTFQFHVSLSSSIPKTKRSILSTIAKIFDPLGWGTPVTVKAKVMIQNLWQRSCEWDDVIPADLFTSWTEIYSSLENLEGVSIPRWIQHGSDTVQCELHGFSDASSAVYAAAVYVRVSSVSGNISTFLLMSKSKVAPIKSWIIPRLELAAAVLLTRICTYIRTSLPLSLGPCYCWTDSSVVLAWVQQHPSRWKTFVANRVSEIQTTLPTAIWRHVPTRDNPADCASRGIRGSELADHPLWWHGPPWLKLDPSEWPPQSHLHRTSVEEKPTIVAHEATVENWDLATRYSSWPKLVRVTAYILRFVSHVRRSTTKHPKLELESRSLTADECHRARLFWFRRVQLESFPTEYKALLNRQSLSSRSVLVSLRPFLDKDQIIRVGGRLQQSVLPLDAKHPIVLASHSVVALIVQHAHLRSLHAGPQLTLSTLRREYWIIRARNIVRSLIHKCVVCTRERATVPTQLMGSLPRVRVAPPSRAFLHCGVDYAGPILVRSMSGRGIASRKAYISVFVCMSTRAVHLELVDGYSTRTFIAAFSRFCSRRGLPATIYSDNGTTFVGADRELTQAFHAALRDPDFRNRTANDGVSWNFIPPAAPHFGGLWEAGVRSVKHHLRRIVGCHTLTFEELTTLLCSVEACLNSRPLAPLRDSFEDFEPLTPGHFLIGSAITALPEPSTLGTPENRLSRWQLVRQMTERFWKLWATDYLHTLQQRGKWRTVSPSPIKVGYLVLLRNPGLPPCKWELGRVLKCHPGADGLTGVITVKTATSEYVRPISKVCLLPIDIERDEAEICRDTPM